MRRSMTGLFLTLLMAWLAGCSNGSTSMPTTTEDLTFLTYNDIDTVCETPALSQAGTDLLSAMEGQLLLSYALDSNIELTQELGDYDHLVLTNPLWVQHFGDPDNLIPVPFDQLSETMQDFLSVQLPLLTVDDAAADISLYEYRGDPLLIFPVNVTLGAAAPISAQNPLLLLVEHPTKTLRGDSCLLPLTSSGNILFSDGAKLQQELEHSPLHEYASMQSFKGE